LFDIEVFVQLFHALFLQPFLGIGELAVSAIDIELAGTKVPAAKDQS
jgi:hypothetical protein